MREENEILKDRITALELQVAAMQEKLDTFFADLTGEIKIAGEPDPADIVPADIVTE